MNTNALIYLIAMRHSSSTSDVRSPGLDGFEKLPFFPPLKRLNTIRKVVNREGNRHKDRYPGQSVTGALYKESPFHTSMSGEIPFHLPSLPQLCCHNLCRPFTREEFHEAAVSVCLEIRQKVWMAFVLLFIRTTGTLWWRISFQ